MRERETERESKRTTSSKGTKGLGCAKEGERKEKRKAVAMGEHKGGKGEKVGETLVRSRRRADETRAYETREKERGPTKNRVGKEKKTQKEGAGRGGGGGGGACVQERKGVTPESNVPCTTTNVQA